MWGELSCEWGELSSECGASCLGASFLWGELSWGELSLGRVVRNPLLKHYFFFKKSCLITQSKLLISVYLRICINDIAICTKVSLFTDLVGMETFGTSIWRNILFILLKII